MKISFHITVLFSLCFIVGADTVSPLDCSKDDFTSLHEKVSMKRDSLARLVANASGTGIDCTYEYITLNITELFLNYSLYDMNNTDILCQSYSSFYGKGGCDLGKAVPCRELNKAINILDKATTDLDKLIKTPSLYRRPVPRHNFKSVVEVDGYFYNNKSMEPLFAGGYDHPSYTSVDVDFLKQLIPIGQDSHEVLLQMNILFPSKGVFNSSEINRIVDNFNQLYSLGFTSNLLIKCVFPQWLIDEDPELAKYGGSNCFINTDDPAVLDLWKKGLTPLLEKLKNNPAVNSYRLGNEVHFGVTYNQTSPVSNYTVTKWHQWLMNKYKTISQLNAVWKRSFVSFDQIYFPVELNPKTHILFANKSLIGGAYWYDYCRFNGDRIVQYYADISNIIKSVDPTAKTHIKYINYELFTDYYCSGVDRITLNNLTTEWSGCDTRTTSAPFTFYVTPFRNSGQYALDWITPTIAYTWMRTTTPTKPVIDLETHPVSTSKYRNGSLPDNHMSAVTWLTHLHGVALHKTWAWTRSNTIGSYSSYKFDIVDTYPTLPQAIDSYVRTLALINALGKEVLALVKAPKPVCMLWSRDSSIQDMDYLHAQIDTFEALSFYGPQPQFIAEPLVESTDTFTDRSCKVLVIPGQSYVSDEIVDIVRSYVIDKKGSVIFTGNDTVFHYTPIGDNRSSSDLKWMKGLPHLSDQDPEKLLRSMEPYLSPANEDRIITCIDQSTNTSVWGLICRGAKAPDTKSTLVFVLNTLTVPVQASFYTEGGHHVTDAKDMYMNEKVDLKTPLTIKPMDVMLFQIE